MTMIDPIDRRELLTRGAAASLGLALAGGVSRLFAPDLAAAATGAGAGYGPLVPDPAGLLSLPEGFQYKVLARSGVDVLDDGTPYPGDLDAGASFPLPRNHTALVVNHEISTSDPEPVPARPGITFNPAARGGCTVIVLDAANRVVSREVAIAGTLNNCAGGATPWGTWITCEESEGSVAGVRHGWNFEVDPLGAGTSPKPIKAHGRFAHESVAVDPETGVVFQTEDASNPNGLFFRWTPPAGFRSGPGAYATLSDLDGALEALYAVDGTGALVPDLSIASEPGTTFRTQWRAVPDRLATTTSVRRQFPGGITRSRKLEGMWWGDGGAYFVASYARPASDGSAKAHEGQVWFHDPKAQTVELKLQFATQPDKDLQPDGPDTITVSPYGGVIVAEDGDGLQHLVGATDDGESYFLARNEDPQSSEFAGVNFSPDRKTLFANVQNPGYVFAITGPFKSRRGSR